jgi:hypothetical protein
MPDVTIALNAQELASLEMARDELRELRDHAQTDAAKPRRSHRGHQHDPSSRVCQGTAMTADNKDRASIDTTYRHIRRMVLLEIANKLAHELFETATTEHQMRELEEAKDYTALMECARQFGIRQGHNLRTKEIVDWLMREAA